METEKQRRNEKARAHLVKRMGMYKRVFGTVDGQQVLALLEEEFYHDPMESNDPNEVFRLLGRRDVVSTIRAYVNSKFDPGEEVETDV